MADMAFGVLDDVVVVLNTRRSPSANEWSGFIDLYISTKLRCPEVKRLVFSDGGGPDAAQRSALNKVLSGHRSPCAVVTDSVLARGVVKAFGIFDPTIRAYASSDWGPALAHVGLGRSRWSDARELLRQFERSVGATSVTERMVNQR